MVASEVALRDRNKKKRHAGTERMEPTREHHRKSRRAMRIQHIKDSSDDTDTAVEDETVKYKATIRSPEDDSTLKNDITVDEGDHALEQTRMSFKACSVSEEPLSSATDASHVVGVSNEKLGEMMALMGCVSNMLEVIVTDHKRTVEDIKRIVKDNERIVKDNERVSWMIENVFETMKNIERRCPNLESSVRQIDEF